MYNLYFIISLIGGIIFEFSVLGYIKYIHNGNCFWLEGTALSIFTIATTFCIAALFSPGEQMTIRVGGTFSGYIIGIVMVFCLMYNIS